MKQHVWVACGLGSAVNNKPVRSILSDVELNLVAERQTQNERGDLLSKECFEVAVYGTEHAPRFERMPHFFKADGQSCVSAACRDVLKQFDLGRSAFYPIAIYQKDRKTLVPGEYFAINFANTKNALAPEQSTSLHRGLKAVVWTFPGWIKDDEIAVTPSALERPDWWIDERLYCGLFISDRMAKALKAVKMSSPFKLRRCRVVDLAPLAKGDA